MNLNLTLISGEEMRAASAFITLLADIREGNTKDGNILSAIMSKGLDHVKDNAPIAMAVHEFAEAVAEKFTADAVAEQPVKEAVKRPRKPKVEEPVVEQGNVQAGSVTSGSAAAEPAGPASSAASAPTIDDVRAALQRFTAVHGMDKGIQLLRNYGAGRISEMTEEQFPLFIAECDAKDE